MTGSLTVIRNNKQLDVKIGRTSTNAKETAKVPSGLEEKR